MIMRNIKAVFAILTALAVGMAYPAMAQTAPQQSPSAVSPVALPPSAVPGSAAPQGSSPQGNAPQASAPQGAAPQASSPQGTFPQAVTARGDSQPAVSPAAAPQAPAQPAYAYPMPAGAAQTPAPPRPAATQAPAGPVSLSEGYVLGVGDVVQVSVLGRPEFDVRVQVQNDNTIQLPFINTLTAANRTVLQLQDQVRRALVNGGFYSDPAVVVNVVTYASRYVIVLGAVSNPGIVPIDRSYRMSEIIARAGGSSTIGVDTVRLTRVSGEQIDLSMDEIATGGPREDPIVNPGDKVFVSPAKTFYIYGEIAQPGSFPIERGLTLRKAIARCGGLTSLGSEKRIKVIRDGIEIKKYGLSQPIMDGDVIVVGQRFF